MMGTKAVERDSGWINGRFDLRYHGFVLDAYSVIYLVA